MTVEELIKQLEDLPEELKGKKVYVPHDDWEEAQHLQYGEGTNPDGVLIS